MIQSLRRKWTSFVNLLRETRWAVPMVAVSLLILGLSIGFGGLSGGFIALGYLKLPWLVLAPRDIVEGQPTQNVAKLASGLQKMLFFTVIMFPNMAMVLMGAQALSQWLLLLVAERGQRLNQKVSPTVLLLGVAIQLCTLAARPVPFAAAMLLTLVSATATLAWCIANRSEFLRDMRMRLHTA